FYSSRSAEQQRFLRRSSLLNSVDPQTADRLLQTEGATIFLADLEKSLIPFVRILDGNKYELRDFFREFLREKLFEVEGKETARQLHSQIAAHYEALGDFEQAVDHSLVRKGEYEQALHCLRSALNLAEQEASDTAGRIDEPHGPDQPSETNQIGSSLASLLSHFYQKSSISRWFGGILGVAVWAYLWFRQPDIGLEPQGTQL